MKTKTLFILVILIVVGIGAAFLFLRETREPGSLGDSAGLIIGKNAIYAAEQSPSNIVSVAIVRFAKPGFVAVHEDLNEAPGGILGTSNLIAPDEIRESLPITLSRSTLDGETIYVMLYFDNGDGGFDVIKDRPVVDPTANEPMMMIVVIGKDATEPDAINP